MGRWPDGTTIVQQETWRGHLRLARPMTVVNEDGVGRHFQA